MKNKLILLVFFTLSSFTLSYGQTSSEYTSGISQFLNWVSDLETVLLNITDKEELKTIDRQLGYASYDINRIAWQKEYLALSISNLKNAKEDDKIDELKPIVDDLIIDIDKLISRLWSIKGKLSQTDQIVVDKIINSITSGYRNRKLLYLKDIKKFLYGEDIPLSKIMKEAKQAKKIADEATLQINEARKIIKTKLK
ncbi:MAG: hypothetical protein CMD31_01265 [Flavobacteriales bacterium]|jgi:hypothetical protein|nr:hypothetical protein [Flavobacteriales bacterium]|tara:strand:+ start:62825 stop:63415 length:591 start_codon:yes stop_codon:yes gene_type:complete